MAAKSKKAFYKSILQGKRYRESIVKDRTIAEESISDKARIIFSSSFRRLQQKAQVFSLESNASVRSRLAHSLEVAETGTRIARIICDELFLKKEIDEKSYMAFIQFVENACLVHDIGNPPFGHFGESAISKWFKANWRKTFAVSLGTTVEKSKANPEYDILQNLIYDFHEFDGNPQGIRIITKLQSIDDTDIVGLNLTFTQILSILKYTRTTQGKKGIKNKKKPAYFQSEDELIKSMKDFLGVGIESRFALSYIMEAADDISYCLSDLEDGIEKKIITYYDIFDYFYKKYREIDDDCPEFVSKFIHDYKMIIDHGYESSISKWSAIFDTESDNRIKSNKRMFLNLKTGASNFLIKKAADIYLKNHQSIMTGKSEALFSIDSNDVDFLVFATEFAKKYLYQSEEAEKIELAGYRIISSLLDSFSPLLKLRRVKFSQLASGENVDNTEIERRLFNKLPEKYVDVYFNEVQRSKSDALEWFYRSHLIVDYISGMTDDYALETYRNLMGISLS